MLSRIKNHLRKTYGTPNTISTIIKIFLMIMNFYSIRIIIGNSGTEIYGVYSGLIAIAGMLTILDFGIANSLINYIAKAKDSIRNIKIYLSTSIFLISIFYLFLNILCLIFRTKLSQSSIATQLVHQLTNFGNSILIVTIGAFALTVANLAQKVYLGLQENGKSYFWSLSCNALATGSVVAFSFFQNTIPWMLIGYLVIPGLYGSLAWIGIFKKFPNISPIFKLVKINFSKNILQNSQLYFFLQIISLATVQSDSLYILWFLGPLEAGILSVTMKVVLIPVILTLFFTQPLWARSATLSVSGNTSMIWSELKKAIFRILLFGLFCSTIILLFGAKAISQWTSGAINPDLQLLIAAVLVMNLMLISQPISMVLNGLNIRRLQYYSASLSLIINLVLSILFTKYYGIIGPLLGTIIAQSFVSILPAMLLLRSKLQKEDSFN